ncbi:MAG: hypothetical protein ACRD1C_13390 [Terriglobales bacterium]
MQDSHPAWRAGVLAGIGLELALLGGGVAAWAAWLIATRMSYWLLGETVMGAAMIAIAAGVVRQAARRQHPEPPPPAELRRLRRSLVWLAVSEASGYVLVNLLAIAGGHIAWLPALNVLLLGAHLLPLGAILRQRVCTLAGALLCLAAVASLGLLPASAHLGAAPAWFAVPLLAGGWILLFAAAAGLRQGRRALGLHLV